MADEIDATNERELFITDAAVKDVCNKAHTFDPGKPGDCDLCGETFKRVVQVIKGNTTIDACGRCRDKHGLT